MPRFPIFLLAVLGTAGCRDRPAPGTVLPPASGACDGARPASLGRVWNTYISSSSRYACVTACHADGAGKLLFRTPEEFHASVFEAPANNDVGMLQVKPGDPDHSYLYRKLLPGADNPMPQGGPFLSADELREVAGWICDGAKLDLTGLDGGVEDGGASDGGLDQRPSLPPIISAFQPVSGSPGDQVVIMGEHLGTDAMTTKVAFNGASATNIQNLLDISLVAQVPMGATTGPITVTTPAGAAKSAADFTVVVGNPAPVLMTLMPNMLVAGSGPAKLTLGGSGFIASSQASAGGPLATQYVSGAQLTADLPGSSTLVGSVIKVTVTNPMPGGGTSAAVDLTVTNPAPVLNGVSPSTAGAGGAAFVLTATGTGFNAASVVTWNGVNLVTHPGTSMQVTADVPQANIANAGMATIRVVNPAPGGGQSAGQTVTISMCSGTPTLTGIMPTAVASGAPFTLTASGACFACGMPSATLEVAGNAVPTTCVSSTALTAQVPGQSPGTYPVTVKNPSGATSAPATLTVQMPNPVPMIASLSPTSAAAGGPALTLTINGSGFLASSQANYNGSPRVTKFVSANQITADIQAGDITNAGMYPVTVTNPAPGGGTSNSTTFNVVANNPVPSIGGLMPNSAAAGSGALTVTIIGSGFIPASQAQWNGAARSTRLVDATHLAMDLAMQDLASPSSNMVTVANPNPGGGTSNAATFTVQAPRAGITGLVSSQSSTCGAVAGSGNFTLTISGMGFVNGATVTFNGQAVMATVSSTTSISASVPGALIAAAPPGNVAPVVVTNPMAAPSAPFPFGVASSRSTLSGNVQPILNASCTGGMCHTGVRSNTMDGLPGILNLNAGATFAATVNVGAIQPPARCGFPEKLFKPCDPSPNQSYMIDKIKNIQCYGAAMPKAAPLNATEKQAIVDWVAQGAPNN